MSMFRKNRLSDEQLRELLQGLPEAKASADFEKSLDRLISSHSHHVPSLLGSLPLVPAPDDFDARLKEAINDRRRPVAPIPVTVAAGGASINWINHIMGWIGGSLAMVALAFFINHASEIAPEASKAPARETVPTESVAPAAPAVVAAPQAAKAAPAPRQMSVVVDQPVAVAAAAPRVRTQPSQPARLRRAAGVAPSAGESSTALGAESTTSDQNELRAPMESASTTNTGDSATGPTTSTESDADMMEKDGGSALPNGVVNTGGDPGVDTSNNPK